MKKLTQLLSMFLMTTAFLMPEIASASEFATFESFYKGSGFGLMGWGLAALGAVIGGAVIFFTGGAASPIVAGIGSWIGGTMGLSGIAATNAGLALLGGGSIATGGFGIAGGVAVLSAALTFGTGVVIDYSAEKVITEYQYSQLVEQSKKMPTLPIPKNDDGSDAYESAIEILEDINNEESLATVDNQFKVERAIKIVEKELKETESSDVIVRNKAFLSILYFASNDYEKAKELADSSIAMARMSEIRRTVPAFVYAVSSIYEGEFDYDQITEDYFSYAILAEPDNVLIPMLFSIYLDRISLRFNDGYLNEETYQNIFKIMNNPAIEQFRVLDYTALLARYFVRLKLEQQKISSLATSTNATIRSSATTLETVKTSLENYKYLVESAEKVMNALLTIEDMEDDEKVQAHKFYTLFKEYENDQSRLSQFVNNLETI